jgi:hypothetical protein
MLSTDRLLRRIGAPWPRFAPLNFLPHSSITIITPLAHPALHIRHSSFPGGAPLFPADSSYYLSNCILIHRELTYPFNSNALDITNRAIQHWNSISPTHQARIIRKYKERLQLLSAVDEMRVPAFVGPDEMGDLVDDMETMFD